MTATEKKIHKQKTASPGGLSWRAMLFLVALAILIAGLFAYLLVDPYFHQHAP